MAFERKILGLTTSGQDVLVCGIGLSIVVHSLTVVNDTGAARVVTLSFYDQANGVTLPLGKLNVGANASARWPDKVNLAPGDKLIASADAGDAVTLYAGYLQQGGAAPVASGFVVRGVWSNLASYDALDVTSKDDVPYVAIQASTNQDPETATAYWMRLLDAAVIAAALAGKADIADLEAAVAALNAALGDDPDFATTVASALAGKQPLNAVLTALAALTGGVAGQAIFRTADGFEYGDAGGGAGGVDLVSAVSANASSVIELEGVFTDAYEYYELVLTGIVSSAASETLAMRLKIAGAWKTDGAYFFHLDKSQAATSAFSGAAVSAGSQLQLAGYDGDIGNSASMPSSITVRIPNPADAATYKHLDWSGHQPTAGGAGNVRKILGAGGYSGVAGALTGVRIYLQGGGNITAKARLYGYKK